MNGIQRALTDNLISKNKGQSSPNYPSHRGSLTVEASMVMSLLIVVLFLVLEMTLFLTDSVRMDALMTEDSTYTAEESRESRAWLNRNGKGFFFLKASRITRSEGSKNLTVTYPGQNVSLGFHLTQSIRKNVERQVCDPVKYLHCIAQLKNK